MNVNEARWRELGLWPQWRERGAVELQTSAPDASALTVAEHIPSPMAANVMVSSAVSQPVEAARTVKPSAPQPAQSFVLPDSWEELEAAIAACTRCRLHEGRHLSVPGVGDRNAPWFFVGEGPGAEEDQQGEPFVGQAGRLLDNMLGALDLKRGQGVYIANVVKCRPPHNRNPEADERTACMPWLQRQIEWVRPRVLVLLGKVAAESLLGATGSLSSLRGKVHQWQGIPVIVTWHPAYLLRSPQHKQEAWQDLCLARKTITTQPS